MVWGDGVSVKSFGNLLIIMGVMLAISLYVIFQNPNRDVMTNLAYTALFEISPAKYGTSYSPTGKSDIDLLLRGASANNVIIARSVNFTLGQGLVFPLAIVCIGLIFYLEIFDSKSVVKKIPFLKEK